MSKKVVRFSLINGRTMPECVIEGGFFAKDTEDVWRFSALGIADLTRTTEGIVKVFESEQEILDDVNQYFQDADYVDDLGNHKTYRVAKAVAELYAKVA